MVYIFFSISFKHRHWQVWFVCPNEVRCSAQYWIFLKHSAMPFLSERWEKLPDKYIYYLARSSELRDERKVNCKKKDSCRFCFLLFLPCFKSVFSVKTSFQSKSCLASLYQAWGGSTESSPAWAQPISNGQYSCRKSCLAEFQISLNKLLYAHALIVSVQSSSWKLILKAANICIDSVVLFENESSQAEKEKKKKKTFHAYNKINIFSVYEKTSKAHMPQCYQRVYDLRSFSIL